MLTILGFCFDIKVLVSSCNHRYDIVSVSFASCYFVSFSVKKLYKCALYTDDYLQVNTQRHYL